MEATEMTRIQKVLQETPAVIARLGSEAEESRFIWQAAKIRLKQEEAKLHLKTKAEKSEAGLTAGDLKAHVDADEKIYQQRLDVITFESTYRKLEKEIEARTESLNSAKILAKMEMNEKITGLGG